MNWDDIQYFNKEEFFSSADLMAPSVIYKADAARGLLKERMFLSPVQGALARFGVGKGSQHFVGETPSNIVRQSTAIDTFIEGIPFLNFSTLLHSNIFSGIGIYLDTYGTDGLPWVMFHLDERKSHNPMDPLVWVCIKEIEPNRKKLINKYYYPQNNSEHWKLLNRKIFFTERTLA